MMESIVEVLLVPPFNIVSKFTYPLTTIVEFSGSDSSKKFVAQISVDLFG